MVTEEETGEEKEQEEEEDEEEEKKGGGCGNNEGKQQQPHSASCVELPRRLSWPYGYVCKLSTLSVTPPKTDNHDGDRTFLENHALTLSHCPLFGTPPI